MAPGNFQMRPGLQTSGANNPQGPSPLPYAQSPQGGQVESVFHTVLAFSWKLQSGKLSKCGPGAFVSLFQNLFCYKILRIETLKPYDFDKLVNIPLVILILYAYASSTQVNFVLCSTLMIIRCFMTYLSLQSTNLFCDYGSNIQLIPNWNKIGGASR